MKLRIRIQLVLLLLLFAALPVGVYGAVDNTIYEELLKKYVKAGVVDYKGFKQEESRLDRYLDVLEKTDTNALDRNDQFAFYVNAYNAWTIKLILSGYPGLDSIKDLSGLFKTAWEKEIARIDGKVVTLDHIEHDILRPRFKDPRVHFAVNCASKGCPPLISEPYNGVALDEQLNRVTRAFLNDPERNRLEGNILYVSKIFKWFKEDFNKDTVGFIMNHADNPLKKTLSANRRKVKVKYLDYDWSLNGN